MKLRSYLKKVADVNFQPCSRTHRVMTLSVVASIFNFLKCALAFTLNRFIFKDVCYIYISLAATEEC